MYIPLSSSFFMPPRRRHNICTTRFLKLYEYQAKKPSSLSLCSAFFIYSYSSSLTLAHETPLIYSSFAHDTRTFFSLSLSLSSLLTSRAHESARIPRRAFFRRDPKERASRSRRRWEKKRGRGQETRERERRPAKSAKERASICANSAT